MDCPTHEAHAHQHDAGCGHPKIIWMNKEAFLHDGHLHQQHSGHWDETSVDISPANPDACAVTSCVEDHLSYPAVPHGDHVDRLIGDRLHHEHGGHCDDHGVVNVAA